ncbi:hypothetical protein OJAV_G00073770 [Oryzias javanicus]|uniref:G-protein coupled receptors family 1 profile domain-containing protein n=1 Tax=Oryzias javanicus TaxID=123683 RepID=A0A437D2S6_ORYJA|nr:hypothetical protein OJAV_G00073770 [Oryzias javanicus]
MLFGLLGNILTILVVWLRPHMRSSTYLYLSSMAISDLLILLLLPLDLYKLWRPRPWPLGDLACKLTMFLSECCTFCTILHITFLSLERYLAVCWPITAKTLVTRRRTRAIIGCLWLGAAVSAAPVLLMVGVEDVGGEEVGFSQWREEAGWSGWDGEHAKLVVSEREGRSSHFLDAGTFGEKQAEGWSEGGGGEFQWFEDKDSGVKNETQHEEKSKEEGKNAFKEDQQNKKKEDEGGGKGGSPDGRREAEADRRECRCTQYAISSGLLSAMMILSNLYFLVPLSILGLVYSLIGRTLWLRPKSSRKEQSHRNTVKMLGVIVLAFVLCWLPFHVGRTIFSLSLGSVGDRQESNPNTDALADVFEPFGHSESDVHFYEPLSQPDEMAARALTEDKLCHTCADTKDRTRPQTDQQDITQTERPPENSDRHTHKTGTHTHPNLHQMNTTLSMQDTTAAMNTQHISSEENTILPTNDPLWPSDTHGYFLYYLSQYFNLVSSVLFYLSAAINPLLYNLMSARYRLAVRSLVRRRSQTQAQHLRTLTVRQSTTTV